MTLDCNVVLGGSLSEYLEPYLDILRGYVGALDAFSDNIDYVQLSRLRRHITPLGAALYFLRGLRDGRAYPSPRDSPRPFFRGA